MKKTSNVLQLFAAVVIGVSLVPWSHGQVVYDNKSAGDQNVRFNPGLIEVGDEITLGAGGRQITSFEFQYWGLSFSGNETARLRFYQNNGAFSPSGAQMPGTVFYDSGAFSIGATPRSTLLFTGTAFTTDLGVVVPLTSPAPNTFTWSVQFAGLTGGETAGVDLYSPQTVGSSFDDYWDHSGAGGTWLLLTNTVSPFTPYDFAARLTAVPEPTTLWLAILGGLALLGVRLRASRS